MKSLFLSFPGVLGFVYISAVPCAAECACWGVLGNIGKGGEWIERPTEGLESEVAVLGRVIGSGGCEGRLEISSLVRLFCFFKDLVVILMLPNDLGDRS